MKQKPTALITGGAGFIGSHLGDKLLGEGFEVLVLDNLSSGKLVNLSSGIEFIQGCTTDKNMAQKLVDKADTIFHLSAIASVQASHENWLETHRANQSSTVTLLDCITNTKRSRPQSFVLSSSASVYGNPKTMPISESEILSPLSAYAADKAASEYHVKIGSRIHNIRTSVLRLFNVYGPRQDTASPYSGVISIFASKIMNGEALTIHGTGDQTRDFIYVGDVAEYFYRANQKADANSQTYNICTGKSISINELSHIIADICETKIDVTHEPVRDGDILHSLGDNSRAISNLNYGPQTDMKTGLRHTIVT